MGQEELSYLYLVVLAKFQLLLFKQSCLSTHGSDSPTGYRRSLGHG